MSVSSDSRRVCIKDLSITKFIDTASPKMLMNHVTHTRYPTARLTAESDQQSILSLTLAMHGYPDCPQEVLAGKTD
ncbi:type VI secretion system tube protein Hcp [Shewanella colwelliana]|uniref:type VI secretion system tube protein Hcp n=1 Tax=Shewanella colwelliana TaxID=23 RepID=UPI0009DE1FCF